MNQKRLTVDTWGDAILADYSLVDLIRIHISQCGFHTIQIITCILQTFLCNFQICYNKGVWKSFQRLLSIFIHIYVNWEGEGVASMWISTKTGFAWGRWRPSLLTQSVPLPPPSLKDHDHSTSSTSHVLSSPSVPLDPHSHPFQTPATSSSLLFALPCLSAARTNRWHRARVQAYSEILLFPSSTNICAGAQVLGASPAQATAATSGNA